MAALIFLALFWALPAASGIGLAYLTRRRRAARARRPDRPRGGVAVMERRDDVPARAAVDDVPAMALTAVTLPDTLPTDAWSAVVLERLQRLANLPPDAADGFDGAECIRRATYATYLDCLELGLGAEARALMARAGRHPEVTSV